MLEFLVLGKVPGTDIMLDVVTIFNVLGLLLSLGLLYAYYRHQLTTAAKQSYHKNNILSTSL
jgi:hypothetical protein